MSPLMLLFTVKNMKLCLLQSLLTNPLALGLAEAGWCLRAVFIRPKSPLSVRCSFLSVTDCWLSRHPGVTTHTEVLGTDVFPDVLLVVS